MLKRAEKQDKEREVPMAKSGSKPVDVEGSFTKALTRFPKVIARLGK